MTISTACPCGSGRLYAHCCGPFLEGAALHPTAESLMRSRYTAFVRNDVEYLRATWHPATRPRDLAPDASTQWIGLKILSTEAGGPDDRQGSVEFVARYKLQGRAHRLHERSHFVRDEGKWCYLDGEPNPAQVSAD
ncbi:hypothetical protein CCR95_13370 [Thiocystis minor]|uniref:YchJ family protein n=1 Tax=Thiocystis minor TaxID=61597 RepID=UPI001911675A|nr:YchJ family protein [Thiocystis minor]MBK5965048.1 hypothetical protein [Thiocystis minor]